MCAELIMDMRAISLFLILLSWTSCARATLSTTVDGSFQAIAQGPDSIALYWRHNGRPARIYSEGKLLGTYEPNTSGTFACASVSFLAPGTTYTFRLGEEGPAVTEKTWASIPSIAHFDLLVIGASASGVAAAVSAARLGMKVALVEQTNRLGGMSSNGLGAADIRNLGTANGFFEEFRERVTAFYGGGSGRPRFEPRVANAIIKAMVYEQPNITLYMKTTVIRAILSGKRVLGAGICDSARGMRGQLFAAVTIDATDTADFAAACPAQWRAGREPRTDREPHAGVIYFDDRAQTVLEGSTGQGDSKQQSYAYLMIWKDYGEQAASIPPGIIPGGIDKPNGYDPETYRYSPDWDKTWNASSGKLPNNEYEINTHPFGGDWPGINHDYPIANEQRRREIDAMYRDRALGYLYFMQNERGHKNLGLADDEFLDNGNFPVGLYIREARRVIGEHVLTEDEVTCARTFHRADSIAIAEYTMDSHAMEDLKDPTRKDKGEGEIYLSSFTPWSQVPYGVIVPCNVEGLLVTTAVSATHVAYGTLRLEPVRMSFGQAAAAAAYFSIARNISLRNINPAWIQDKILSQHAYINWNSDVTPETRHFKAINFLGARGVFREEAFRPDDHLTESEALDALDRMIALECGSPLAVPRPEVDRGVSRGLFATWLVEAKRKTDASWNPAPARQSYADVPPDSPYYAAVETLHAHRITAALFEDHKTGQFQPDAPITRADAAQAIYLAHRNYAMTYWRP